jgi:molecular chaperone DnaK
MSQMHYQLGVDLGTTYTAAAVCRDGQERPEVVALGSASSAVPSVVFLGPDGAMVVGDAALRRALTEPRRIAREFKRRIGDGTPLHVGGTEVAACELSARFLAWVVDEVATREGGPAGAVTVTHPVEWGEHKRATFADALAAHGLADVAFLTEPQAAAIGYASTERIDVGGVVGVYDLGGGTFDAAVVRKLADGGFALLGSPVGIERLGGVDFDDAVLDHVRTALGSAWTALDAADPRVQSAVAGLRRECTAAKEALSADTEVLIPVMLPGTHTEVRLGRAEFEDMIRPSVGETVEALRRAIDSAGLTPADLDAVLLVGGSSRIPLISQMVSAELGRSIAVDADPKAVVASGAALAARGPLAVPVPDLLDEAPGLPPVEFEPAPAADEDLAPRRYRRTLLLAASIAVAASFGLSATLASGVVPVRGGFSAESPSDTLLADAGTPVAVDPWTGAPAEETTTPGPLRPDAVAAAVRPVSRTAPTGAAGASAVAPVPGAVAPAAAVPAGATPATTPGATTPGPTAPGAAPPAVVPPAAVPPPAEPEGEPADPPAVDPEPPVTDPEPPVEEPTDPQPPVEEPVTPDEPPAPADPPPAEQPPADDPATAPPGP